MITKVRKFIGEVIVELRKVSWATRQELIDATVIVVISSAILGVFITGADVLLSRIVELLIR